MDNAHKLFSNTRALGTACMLAASLCFSTGGLLMKLIPWNPLAINGARNLIACMVIGLYILVTHHKIKFNFTVLVGAISMAGVTTLYAIANKLTTAGNTIILQYTAPIWIVILMFLFFGQKPDRTSLISILIVFVGILCFFFEGLSTGKWLGDLLALLSGIFYAGVFMLNSFEKGDALSSVFFGQLACGVFLSPLVLRETIFTPPVLLSVFLLGAVQVGLAYVFFTTGTKYSSQQVPSTRIRSPPPSSTRWSRSSIRCWSRSSMESCSASGRWSARRSSSAEFCFTTWRPSIRSAGVHRRNWFEAGALVVTGADSFPL